MFCVLQLQGSILLQSSWNKLNLPQFVQLDAFPGGKRPAGLMNVRFYQLQDGHFSVIFGADFWAHTLHVVQSSRSGANVRLHITCHGTSTENWEKDSERLNSLDSIGQASWFPSQNCHSWRGNISCSRPKWICSTHWDPNKSENRCLAGRDSTGAQCLPQPNIFYMYIYICKMYTVNCSAVFKMQINHEPKSTI